MNFKYLLTSAIVVTSALFVPANEAQAHRDCYKQSLGFPGSWTEICKPHIHPRSGSGSSDSCLSYVSSGPTKYRYKIKNNTKSKIHYTLNGKKDSLNAGETTYWTSTIGNTRYSECGVAIGRSIYPVIKFDSVVGDGKYTKASYNLKVDQYDGFNFSRNGKRLGFYHNSYR
ncbi:MAG: hypothetical protein MK105_18280 [Crocinitomicaceae bacterium]|nr:hypothetical protein [Crocinitomicaceae bacterium]